MKISYASDLHLECDHNFTINDAGDVLILAGDILPIKYANNPIYAKFFEDMASKFTTVLYIPGNHEYYGADLNDIHILRYSLPPNFVILNNGSIIIDGIKFIGGTMWTNLHNGSPAAMIASKQMMNDYRVIHKNDKLFTVSDWLIEHEKFLVFLNSELDDKHINVVISHHAPSPLTTHEYYKHCGNDNASFSTDMSKYMHLVKYWFYGHMHGGYDIEIDGCQILTNPRGYPIEFRKIPFVEKSIEIL
jgi:DNA repair exonuclease SbcCD nuclease subunit